MYRWFLNGTLLGVKLLGKPDAEIFKRILVKSAPESTHPATNQRNFTIFNILMGLMLYTIDTLKIKAIMMKYILISVAMPMLSMNTRNTTST